jgi:hypothetical protein
MEACRRIDRASLKAVAALTLWLVSLAAPASEEPPRSSPMNPSPAHPSGPGQDLPHASAIIEGKPSPGGEIILRGDGSTGKGLRHRWVQTDGPPIDLETPSEANMQVRLPDGPATLGFLLVVESPQGIASAPVTVEVPGGPSLPVASAGDDLRGFVGRPVLLDGSRSAPRGQLGLRWIQIGGPKVVDLRAEGTGATFTPAWPGSYRFLLIVAAGSMISEPDLVDVRVEPPPPPQIDQVAELALGSVEGGHEVADSLAEIFDALAGRMTLYATYADLYVEMSRRLEAIVPADPARRQLWADRIFVPLTASLIDGLRAEGLDLASRDGARAALSDRQHEKLAALFRGAAEGCRAARGSR